MKAKAKKGRKNSEDAKDACTPAPKNETLPAAPEPKHDTPKSAVANPAPEGKITTKTAAEAALFSSSCPFAYFFLLALCHNVGCS